MEKISLAAGSINPEKINSLQSDLKKNFHIVRVKFFRADLPKADFGRPKNVFHIEPGKANYVTVHLANRECLEFHKTALHSSAFFYNENFSGTDLKIIMDALLRHGFYKPHLPPPRPVIMPVIEKPFYAGIFDWIKEIFAK